MPRMAMAVITFSDLASISNILQFMFLPSLSKERTNKANMVQYMKRSRAHVGLAIRAFHGLNL
jgi:hypothetical protein